MLDHFVALIIGIVVGLIVLKGSIWLINIQEKIHKAYSKKGEQVYSSNDVTITRSPDGSLNIQASGDINITEDVSVDDQPKDISKSLKRNLLDD